VTLDWCVATALASHPDISVARSVAAAQMARVARQELPTTPQLAAHAGYWRENAIAIQARTSTATRASTIIDGADYNAELDLGIVLLDFGRRSAAIDASELQLQAARLDVDAARAESHARRQGELL